MSTLPSLSVDAVDRLVSPLPISSGGENPAVLQGDHLRPDDDEDHSEEEGAAGVSHQFSERLGTLLTGPNGEWRFYGATSNLHLVHGDFGQDFPNLGRQKSVQASFDTAGLNHTVDEQLVNHLITLYFTWQNPSLRVVDQEAFETARNEFLVNPKENGFYSELLVNSMYFKHSR